MVKLSPFLKKTQKSRQLHHTAEQDVRFKGALSIKDISLFLLMLLVGCEKGKDNVELVSLSGALSPEKAKLSQEIFGYDLLHKVKVGPWECYAPAHDTSKSLFCSHNGKIVVHMEDGEEFFVSVPIIDGTSLVYVADKDKDGRFDRLQYDTLSPSGEFQSQVTDEDMDGHIDKRVTAIPDAKLMLKIGDEWRQVTDVKNPSSGRYDRHVIVDGNTMRVERKTYPYKLHPVKE